MQTAQVRTSSRDHVGEGAMLVYAYMGALNSCHTESTLH